MIDEWASGDTCLETKTLEAEFLPSEDGDVRSRQRSIIWSELLPPAGARETWDISPAVVLAKI